MYECLLLAISYIAESVRGTRELDTATQAAHYINLNILFDPCIHEQTIIQTHQELNLNNNFFHSFSLLLGLIYT